MTKQARRLNVFDAETLQGNVMSKNLEIALLKIKREVTGGANPPPGIP